MLNPATDEVMSSISSVERVIFLVFFLSEPLPPDENGAPLKFDIELPLLLGRSPEPLLCLPFELPGKVRPDEDLCDCS